MMKPWIGITPDFEEEKPASGLSASRYVLPERYVSAVERAGGIPLILPYVEKDEEVSYLLDRIHGLLITGGAFDIDPSFYGEGWTVRKKGDVKQRRTRFEIRITGQALARDLPLLGICGGEQVINVALKGTLVQDILACIPGGVDHESGGTGRGRYHPVRVIPGTRLYRIVGRETIRVNTSHHQAVGDPGEGIRVNAVSGDGVIEGIESTRHRFVLGVQWHPESLFETEPSSRRVLKALIEEAGKTDLRVG